MAALGAIKTYLQRKGKKLSEDKVVLMQFRGGSQVSHAMSQIVDYIYSQKYGPSITVVNVDVFEDKEGMKLFRKYAPPKVKSPPLLLVIGKGSIRKITRPNQQQIEEAIEELT
jgi:cobalamin biosynthesis Co2+ chelatase CbiK